MVETSSSVQPRLAWKKEAARANAWQMVVVEEQDRAWAQKSPEVDQVDEHGIEAVVAVLSWRRPGRGGLSRKRAAQRLR